jgi:peptide/nickel transport system substrate-binding protein
MRCGERAGGARVDAVPHCAHASRPGPQSCGAKNWFGWPCDETAETLRTAYIKETDPMKQKAVLETLHARQWETIPFVPVGQYSQPTAWRKNITGLLRSNIIAFWNAANG